MAATVDLRLGRSRGIALPVAWSTSPSMRLRRQVLGADVGAAAIGLLITVVVLGASTELVVVVGLWVLSLRQAWYVERRFALNPRDVGAVSRAWVRAALPFAVAAAFIPALTGSYGLLALGTMAGATYMGRVVVGRRLARERRAGRAQVPVVACGQGSELTAFQNMLSRDPAPAWNVASYLVADPDSAQPDPKDTDSDERRATPERRGRG